MSKNSSDVTTLDDAPDVADTKATAAAKKASAQEASKELAATESGAKKDRILLKINAGEGEEGRSAVFLSADGKNVHVPRGEFHEVDAIFGLLLEGMVYTIYENVNGEMVPRSVPRYGYIIKPVA